MEEIIRFLFAFLTLCVCCTHVSAQDNFEYDYVTCGSTFKLLNTRHNVRLHSHDIRYGSGSGQQSVTGVESTTDRNSLWQVRGKADKPCTRGEPVRCGDSIRLMHLATRRNLHSHRFSSPLSHNQEVSGFGEDGEGDIGDNWVVTCSTVYWERDDAIRLKHIVTTSYLTVTGDVYGRPINGQREICTVANAMQTNYWKAAEGIFVKPSEMNTSSDIHDEL